MADGGESKVYLGQEHGPRACTSDIEHLWDDIDDSELLAADLDSCIDSDPVGSSTHGKRKIENTNDDTCALKKPVKEKNVMNDDLVPLKILRSGYLWVSNLVSQNWCEQQMVYGFTLPVEYVENPVMTEGSSLHLARELAVQDVVNVEVTSSEDIWAIKVLNLVGAVDSFLLGTTVRREIPIFGAPFNQNVFIVGLIDEIRCDPETFDFDILEFKTRSASKTLPSKAQMETHKLQVMLYKKLYDDLVKGHVTKQMVSRHLRLRLTHPFGKGVMDHVCMQGVKAGNLDTLLDYTFEKMKGVPCISQCLIEYCFQADQSTIGVKTIDYDEAWLQSTFDHYAAYWQGHREVVGVEIEEAWKCQRCDFADVCQWREKKAKEYSKHNKLKLKNTV